MDYTSVPSEIDKTIINPFSKQDLKIYAYTLPEIPNHNGCIKVGETSRDVEDRIAEQVRTIGVTPEILFKKKAKKITGEWFHDKALHRYFLLNKIEKKDFGTGADEWFYFNGTPERCEELTDKFIRNDYSEIGISRDENCTYELRKEQLEAVEQTLNYYHQFTDETSVYLGESEFLWNAKPRFGKTLTTYDFIRRIHEEKCQKNNNRAMNVLIVTNRPAIANSWWDDFKKFIAWQEKDLFFVSETDALKNKVMSREDYLRALDGLTEEEQNNAGCVAFVSLQDLKGSKYFGGEFDKLEWIATTIWDLLVIDEAHEGVDTRKTDRAFRRIKKRFMLHLSGTPFKAIANNKFNSEQIYNWSYLDEQTAKKNWEKESTDSNPYANLPVLNMFTYQMSKIVEEKVSAGMDISEDKNVDYAFDLGEFFKTKPNGKFLYEDSVKKFLDNLTEKKFPFAESKYRHVLNHTFWLLPGVAACKAMEKLLQKHKYFSEYEVVLAAGDGTSVEDDSEKTFEQIANDEKAVGKSYDRVKKAIQEYDKTITLSCGQLTTGVTIPEWTAVFMLNNFASPALYFQAAFRSQNPYEFTDEKTGELYCKENAYIFDFAPDRTLTLYDDFANNLSVSGTNGTSDERKDNIKELLNFFPVIAEDADGIMHELDVGEVLTIPTKIKSREVVRQGFMSNLLFANISAIFRAPAALTEIVEKIKPEKNKRLVDREKIDLMDPMLNDDDEVEIPPEIVVNTSKNLFGEKIYGEQPGELKVPDLHEISNDAAIAAEAGKIANHVIREAQEGFKNLEENFDLKKNHMKIVKEKAKQALEERVSRNLEDYKDANYAAEKQHKEKMQELKTDEEKEEEILAFKNKQKEIKEKIEEKNKEAVKEVMQETVKGEQVKKEENKKKITEDSVRDHLRGFSRTIPAFLMAYGDRETTLANFDTVVDEKTFVELTSITFEEFRKLRDGITFIDEKTGKEIKTPCLFDEVVFNSSIQEFFDLKDKLSNYLEGDNKEDIFDYIPNQKTNQIFTPRKIVKKMVDVLEDENPGIFSNKDVTFVDLYAKSGMYLTELLKRLNEGLKDQIPDFEARIKHILEKQLYAFAPSNIIYNIVKQYIYSGFPYVESKNLIELDLSKYAEEGKMQDAIKERGGNLKFDVIIGNPPYQKETGGAGRQAKPIYNLFVEEAKKLNPSCVLFIIPSRWFSGGMGLEKFREEMMSDKQIRKIVDYTNSKDCFPNMSVSGGVCYFLWEKGYNGKCNFVNIENGIVSSLDRNLNEFSVLVRNNNAVQILRKVLKFDEILLIDIISPLMPFGLSTNVRGTDIRESDDDLVLYASNGKTYYPREKIKKGCELIDSYKVLLSKMSAEHAGEPDKDGMFRVLTSTMRVLKPGEICTHSYFTIGNFANVLEADNLYKYLQTKFVRYLILQNLSAVNLSKLVFKFVPLQDFTSASDIDWTKSVADIDQQLYKKYGLSEKEIAFIEEKVKPME